MNAHTPGPWNLELHRSKYGKLIRQPYIYAPNGIDEHRHICEPYLDAKASTEIQATQEANARLIAAAPDLLEASSGLWDAVVHHAPPHALIGALAKVEAAVAKAGGAK